MEWFLLRYVCAPDTDLSIKCTDFGRSQWPVKQNWKDWIEEKIREKNDAKKHLFLYLWTKTQYCTKHWALCFF